jgi:hypothetical protein
VDTIVNESRAITGNFGGGAALFTSFQAAAFSPENEKYERYELMLRG